MPITDAYAHCGLRKYKPVEDLDAVMDRYGVARTVIAEHLGEYDNSYIASIVKKRPQRFAGVFLVDVDAPAAMDDITRWTKTGAFRGIRFTSATVLTHRKLWDWAAQLGLHLVISSPFPAAETAAINAFASDHEKTTLQLTHLGGPGFEKRPNIVVQISGMHKESQAPYSGLEKRIGALYDTLGPRRLVYGSNFPVMVEESIYKSEIELLRSGKLGIPEKEMGAVMNGNAVRLWFEKSSARVGSLLHGLMA
ncbi:MAG: amidohydrolase [Acidobacteria bacterium]|nr:amidohydrolase [Acidobacteriota bacterium]